MNSGTPGPLRSHGLALLLYGAVAFCGTFFLAAQEKPQSRAESPQSMQTQAPPAAQRAIASREGQQTLTIGPIGKVTYGPPWAASAMKFSNAHELVRLTQASGERATIPEPAAKQAPPNAGPAPLARILITTEKRGSAEDAARRLQEVALSHRASVRFYAVSGWPAVELQFTQKLPRRGGAEQQDSAPAMQSQQTTLIQVQLKDKLQQAPQQRDEESKLDFSKPSPTIQRAKIAIAVEDDVISFDIMLAPSAPKEVLQEGLEIANGFTANKQENPEKLHRTLQQLEQDYNKKTPPQKPPENKRPTDSGHLQGGKAGTSQVQNGGAGELEVAVSPNGNTIVIASNSSLTHSSDGGATFTGGSAVFGMNDPTLARGKTGAFYLGQIAFPNGSPAQKGVTGCTNAVSRSTNGGANFLLSGFSAVCPTGPVSSNIFNTSFCFTDQPHIAADSFTAGTQDQVYSVFRLINSVSIFGLAGTTSCTQVSGGFITASISCSQDNGATWTATAALSGIDDFPRIAVGADGKVYVVGLSGNSVMLSRFSSCRNGLALDTGFPVTVFNMSGEINCPVAGLDRCENGNTLNSPTVAPDPAKASHITVSFAEDDGSGGERVVTLESNDSGVTFPTMFTLSSPTSARRFMPWSCVAAGEAFVGWYDRGPANSARNDLTNYVVGSTLFSRPADLSGTPDPQCARWPCGTGPRSQNDSESCSVQPELAGVCQNGSGGGSGNRCDFSSGSCPSGESCNTGSGCPKYGDYNGMACADEAVVAAWASATPPTGLPRPSGSGISIFSQTLSVKKTGPPTFDRIQFVIETGNDNADSGLELFATLSGQKRSICLKPSTDLSPDGICANGNGAKDQNGRDTWDNFTTGTQNFVLDTPQTSTAGFKTLTIGSKQNSCSLSCNNWDLQRIVVTVSDSAGKLKPAVLLNVFNPRNTNNNDNCIARLRAPPHTTSVTYTLNAASPGSSPSNFGPTPPGSCPQ